MEFTAAIQTPNIGISEMINAMTSQPQVYTVPAYGNIETSPYGQIQHYVTHVAPGAYIAAPHSAHHQQLIHHQPNLHNRIEFPPPPQPVLEAPRPKEWKRDEDRERERRYSDRDNRDRSERYRSDRDRDRLSTGGGRSRDRERGSDRERGERFLSTSLPKEHHHSRRRGDRERDRHDRGGDATYSRSRDRSRSFRSRSRSRSRSWDREEGQKIGEDIRSFVNAARNASDDDLRQFDYRKTPPNNTIMVRGLAQHITENDILDDILDCQVTAKDIRLVRKKDSGISRGFAFVEFSDIHDAINWMEQKQGVLVLQDSFRAMLQYSNPKEADKWSRDWYCVKCGAHNFKKRDSCFKCSTTRHDSENCPDGDEEVCSYPTNTLILRGLDALSTEEGVLLAIQDAAGDLPIRAVRLGRDPLTKLSWGVCYLELNSVLDAMKLYNNLDRDLPVVDGKLVTVSYCKVGQVGNSDQSFKLDDKSNKSSETKQQQQHEQKQQDLQPLEYTAGADVAQLAEYSASIYAKTPEEMASYRQYYLSYYQQQAEAFSNSTQSDSANAAAAVAQSAMKAKRKKASQAATTSSSSHGTSSSSAETSENKSTNSVQPQPSTAVPGVMVDGAYPKFPLAFPPTATPDVSTYAYEETSGYYYDASTGLYYDGTTSYYYDPRYQRYLYWDAEKSTYLPAPTAENAAPTEAATAGGEGADPSMSTNSAEIPERKDKEKQDKVKVAKKIAKDMARWAKAQNKKNEVPKFVPDLVPSANTVPGPAQTASSTNHTADAAFAVLLERRDRPTGIDQSSALLAGGGARKPGLVAAYGGGEGSDSDDERDPSKGGASGKGASSTSLSTAESKPTCLLCKRQFPTKDALSKHIQLSSLHKKNLEELVKNAAVSTDAVEAALQLPAQSVQLAQNYRDRAKERRLKYRDVNPREANSYSGGDSGSGSDSTPHHFERLAKRPDDYLNLPPPPSAPTENLGSQMMKRMGWTEGAGLGKNKQGPTPVIVAERRAATAGLGMQGASFGVAGDTYKESVKKKMMYRYQERDLSYGGS